MTLGRCGGTFTGSSGGCAGGWGVSRSLICGCRNSIRAGHGFHVHFAVGRYVPRGLIEEAWGRGFVFIKLLQGLPVGSGVREEARVAARYLSKYLGKGMGGAGGLNRYDVAQGFQPRAEPITGPTEAGVIGEACRADGRASRLCVAVGDSGGLAGSSGGVAVMAMSSPTAGEVTAWVEESHRRAGAAVRGGRCGRRWGRRWRCCGKDDGPQRTRAARPAGSG